MAWAIPQFSKGDVERAGRILARSGASTEEIDFSLEVVNNWRAIHAFPLNTFQMGLRGRAAAVYENALVAQRLKRLSSIELKLKRFPTMSLARMQDIGGCRAVLRSPAQVRNLVSAYKESRIMHQLVNEKDYIREPKDSGYRGVHLVYRYLSDKKQTYNGLQIEMQLRTRLQHAWATAVETVGTFLQHSLKSSVGPDDWLRFFALASSVFALAERSPGVPGTPSTKRALAVEIGRLRRVLDVDRRLRSFGEALQVTQDAESLDAHFFLMSLLPGELKIRSFRKDQLDEATRSYLDLEKQATDIVGAQAVLVAADSLKTLRRAYPNYYLDTQVFLRELRTAML